MGLLKQVGRLSGPLIFVLLVRLPDFQTGISVLARRDGEVHVRITPELVSARMEWKICIKMWQSAFLTLLLSDEVSVYTAHCEEVKKKSLKKCDIFVY